MPWERQAMMGNEVPDGLSLPEKTLYVLVRGLYAQYKAGTIDRDTAVREKRAAFREYEKAKFHFECGGRWTKIIKETEAARSAYRKDRTIENADKILLAIDGIL
jgi:hypothetical protein